MKRVNRVLQQALTAVEPYQPCLVTKTNRINPYPALIQTNLWLLDSDYGQKVERNLYHMIVKQ